MRIESATALSEQRVEALYVSKGSTTSSLGKLNVEPLKSQIRLISWFQLLNIGSISLLYTSLDRHYIKHICSTTPGRLILLQKLSINVALYNNSKINTKHIAWPQKTLLKKDQQNKTITVGLQMEMQHFHALPSTIILTNLLYYYPSPSLRRLLYSKRIVEQLEMVWWFS